MKRMLVFFSILSNVFLVVTVGYFYFQGYTQTALLAKYPSDSVTYIGKNSSSLRYSVAVVVPALHKSLEEIQRGFEETLVKKYGLQVTFKVFNANGNRALLRAQIEEIAQQNFAAVFTIGAVATQLTKEVFSKKKVKTPIVFGAVADPVRLGLVDASDSTTRMVTGSAAITNYPLQLELLLLLKPKTRRILLIYDPVQSSGLELDKSEIERECRKLGVSLEVAEVFSTRDVQQKIPLLINANIDVVMILKDNTVVPAVDMLVKQCERHQVTLFTSDLDSVEKGAVLGFGVRERSFGIDAAECACKILTEGLQPAQVPLKLTNAFRFAVNRTALVRQGVILEGPQQRLLEAIEFIDV